MTVVENCDIDFSVSVIACHLHSFENCPDFQYQITECLTLIFNMSANHPRRGASRRQSYKESVKQPQAMTNFFTYFPNFFPRLRRGCIPLRISGMTAPLEQVLIRRIPELAIGKWMGWDFFQN